MQNEIENAYDKLDLQELYQLGMNESGSDSEEGEFKTEVTDFGIGSDCLLSFLQQMKSELSQS